MTNFYRVFYFYHYYWHSGGSSCLLHISTPEFTIKRKWPQANCHPVPNIPWSIQTHYRVKNSFVGTGIVLTVEKEWN